MSSGKLKSHKRLTIEDLKKIRGGAPLIQYALAASEKQGRNIKEGGGDDEKSESEDEKEMVLSIPATSY